MDPGGLCQSPLGEGFPRRRGDGPSHGWSVFLPEEFPPQARGWTPRYRQSLQCLIVSPAGAGMDPSSVSRCLRRRCFPRRRGDGPVNLATIRGSGAFPPQARGWTARSCRTARTTRVSPAGAGMDRPKSQQLLSELGFPRRRGDGPRAVQHSIGWSKFPPQARGWTFLIGRFFLFHWVSPAGAGMDPEPSSLSYGTPGFPRRRGDGPVTFTGTPSSRAFPPQARGWTAGPP